MYRPTLIAAAAAALALLGGGSALAANAGLFDGDGAEGAGTLPAVTSPDSDTAGDLPTPSGAIPSGPAPTDVAPPAVSDDTYQTDDHADEDEAVDDAYEAESDDHGVTQEHESDEGGEAERDD